MFDALVDILQRIPYAWGKRGVNPCLIDPKHYIIARYSTLNTEGRKY
jgi:hypothetical protein